MDEGIKKFNKNIIKNRLVRKQKKVRWKPRRTNARIRLIYYNLYCYSEQKGREVEEERRRRQGVVCRMQKKRQSNPKASEMFIAKKKWVQVFSPRPEETQVEERKEDERRIRPSQ